mmetsp:Transcript_12657/g.24524  ORF Transcript_12657/g.24524 Transcript_12657/m.24524 type:complete len:88 (-) Transcript_12657:59-322(-)
MLRTVQWCLLVGTCPPCRTSLYVQCPSITTSAHASENCMELHGRQFSALAHSVCLEFASQSFMHATRIPTLFNVATRETGTKRIRAL